MIDLSVIAVDEKNRALLTFRFLEDGLQACVAEDEKKVAAIRLDWEATLQLLDELQSCRTAIESKRYSNLRSTPLAPPVGGR